MFISQRDFKERIQQQKSTQNRLREQRQQIARAKKYHSDYHVQHRARLMRARTKEERVGENMEATITKDLLPFSYTSIETAHGQVFVCVICRTTNGKGHG